MNTAKLDFKPVQTSRTIIVTEDMFESYDGFDPVEYCKNNLLFCNQGLDIFDAIEPPLVEAYGKTSNPRDGVAETKYVPPKRTKWVSNIVWDEDDLAWEARNPFTDEVYYDEPYMPSEDVLQFGKTSTKIDFPELECFDDTPASRAIVAAAQYSTLLEAEGSDPTEILHRFEDMWSLPRDSALFLKNYRAHDISIPRMIASAGKVRNPIYGLDNYAGCVKILRSDITRSNFLTEKDVKEHAYSVVDFGRFHAFLRYVVAANLALPGISSDALKVPSATVGWTVSKHVATIYKPGDHYINLPKMASKAAIVNVEMLESMKRMTDPTYLAKLLGMYENLVVDDQNEITTRMVRKTLTHLNNLAKRADEPIKKTKITIYDNILPEDDIFSFPTRNYKPFTYRKSDIDKIIESVFTRKDETGYYYTGILHNVFTDVRSSDIMFPNERNDVAVYANNTVSDSERSRVLIDFKENRIEPETLGNKFGITLSKKLDKYSNFIKVAIFADFECFRTRLKRSYKLLYEAHVEKSRFNDEDIQLGIAMLKACSRFAAYYKGKGEEKRAFANEIYSEITHAKRVFYQLMSKFYIGIKMSELTHKLIFPNVSAFLIDVGLKYAKKKKKSHYTS